MLKKQRFILLGILVVALGAVVFKQSAHVYAAPQTFTVNSIGDEDDDNYGDNICHTALNTCTLRAALSEASINGNSADTDVVEFNILPMDGSVKHILVTGGLPTLDEPVTIDGYTQDDATPNTNPSPQPMNGKLLIDINGQGLPGRILYTNRSGSTIKGLILGNSTDRTVNFEGPNASNNKIQGSYVNVDSTGLAGVPTTYEAVGINGGGHNNLVGGTNPEDRNIISNTVGGAVVISDFDDINPAPSNNNRIEGNFIGVGKDDSTSTNLAQSAVQINGLNNEGNIIGGSASGAANILANSPQNGVAAGADIDMHIINNVITNNANSGITIFSGTGYVIKGNSIGVGSDGVTAAGNIQHGIYLTSDVEDSIIGGTSISDANTIANNNEVGIVLAGSDNMNVAVLGNSIFNNGQIGIDINHDGVTQNDVLDTDTGANQRLNFPVATNVSDDGTDTEVTYNLDVPAGDYRIELFTNTTRDSTGYGEGEAMIASQNITSTGSGVQTFTLSINGTGYSNIAATATVIDSASSSGFGFTSEFGNFVQQQVTTDVGIEKTLTNPQDVARGAMLHYDFKYTNNGSDDLDLTQFNDIFAGKSILTDFVAPDITPENLDVSGPFPGTYYITNAYNPNIDCVWLPHGSALVFLGTTDHPDWGVVLCAYTAIGVLPAGQDFDFGLDFTVSNSSELAFKNYAIAPAPTESFDPDSAEIDSILTSGGDPLTLLIETNGLNNFASALGQGQVDLGVSTNLVNPQDIAPGAIVYYDVKLTNRGPAALDLADYRDSGTGLTSSIYPGDDLTLIGPTNSNIGCGSAGPGSNAFLGNAAIDHPSYQILTCTYSGAAQSSLLLAGSSLTIRLQFTASPSVASAFNFYTVSFAGFNDPDAMPLYAQVFSATGDILDTISSDNFARTVFPVPVSSNSGGSTVNQPAQLSQTGEGSIVYLAIALTTVLVSTVTIRKTIKR